MTDQTLGSDGAHDSNENNDVPEALPQEKAPWIGPRTKVEHALSRMKHRGEVHRMCQEGQSEIGKFDRPF